MKKLLLLAVALAGFASVHAQDNYPSRTVRIVVPFGAGNLTDTYARVVAQKMGDALKQPVIVENKPGATSILGAMQVAQAAPDGYTLLFTASTHVIAAVTRKKPPFDPLGDFTPVGLALEYPYYMIGALSLPAKTLPELVAYGKAHPGKLNYGTVGEGSGGHLLGQIFEQITGVKATHVPYKATSGFLTGLQNGEVDFAFDSIGSAHSLVTAGRIKGFAVTSDKRFAAAPDVPTMKEAGVAGFESWLWLGLLAPAKTPPAIIAKLNSALNEAMQAADTRARMDKDGLQLATGSPSQFAARIKDDAGVWGGAAKRAGVSLD